MDGQTEVEIAMYICDRMYIISITFSSKNLNGVANWLQIFVDNEIQCVDKRLRFQRNNLPLNIW